MDLTSAAPWLEKYGYTLLAALLSGLTSAWLVTRFQERRRVRREHLDEIKGKILRPLQREIEEFYLPLLQSKLGPIVVEHVLLPVEGSLIQASTPWEWRLAQRRKAGDQWLSLPFEGQRASQANSELFTDTKRRHYRRFIRRLEAFKAEVDDYTQGWMPYADHLARVIADRVGLPVVTWRSANTSGPWVDVNRLAVFVLERQLGGTPHSPNIIPEPPSLQIASYTMARAQTTEQIQHIIGVLEDLYRDRAGTEEPRRRAERLEQHATDLLSEISRLLLSSKLKGRCRFTKV